MSSEGIQVASEAERSLHPKRGVLADKLMVMQISELQREFYVRTGLNHQRVVDLRNILTTTNLPPILVSADKKEIIDGRHRVESYLSLGRTEIACIVRHFKSRQEKIAAAVQANWGGSLPQTSRDLLHAVEMLIHEGAGVRQLSILLPFLGAKYIRELYDDACSNTTRRKVMRAVAAVIEEDMTVAQAAKQYGADSTTVKNALNARRKKAKKATASPLAVIQGSIQRRTRGTSQANGKILRLVFDQYEIGEIDSTYVDAVLALMDHEWRTVQHYVEDQRNRFVELQRKVERAIAATPGK